MDVIGAEKRLNERLQILNRNHITLFYTGLLKHLTHGADIIWLLRITPPLWKPPFRRVKCWITRVGNRLSTPRCSSDIIALVNLLPLRLRCLILVLIQMRMVQTPHPIPQLLKRPLAVAATLVLRDSVHVKTNIVNIRNLISSPHQLNEAQAVPPLNHEKLQGLILHPCHESLISCQG